MKKDKKQKMTSKTSIESQEQYFLRQFENKIFEIDDFLEMEDLFKKLQYLGLHFDPFQENQSLESQQILEQLGIQKFILNPYEVTNLILKLLDLSEERLNRLKH